MADEQGPSVPGAEPTIPPGPPAPFEPAVLATPLAPPIGTPSVSPYGMPPAPQSFPPQPTQPPQPEYPQAQYPQPEYPQAQYPQPAYPQPPSGYPLAPGPRARVKPPAALWVIVLISAGSVLALIVASVFVMVAVILPLTETAQPAPAPTGPIGAPTWPGTGTDEDAGDIGGELQAKIDQYKGLRDSGALWQQIPDGDFNRTAVQAFLYFLIDMKSATIIGIDKATADEYRTDMADLEQRLLAQQPLGSDIELRLSDGRVFRYNGTTGEGGYFDE